MECTAATAEGRNRSGKRSFTDARASGDVAPKPDIGRATRLQLGSHHSGIQLISSIIGRLRKGAAMSDGHWQLRGSAAELYQRYLVPAITTKWAEDIAIERSFAQARKYWISPVAPAS